MDDRQELDAIPQQFLADALACGGVGVSVTSTHSLLGFHLIPLQPPAHETPRYTRFWAQTKLTCAVDGNFHVWTRVHQRRHKETHRNGLAKAPRSRYPAWLEPPSEQRPENRPENRPMLYMLLSRLHSQDFLIDTLPCIHFQQPRIRALEKTRRVHLEENTHDGIQERLLLVSSNRERESAAAAPLGVRHIGTHRHAQAHTHARTMSMCARGAPPASRTWKIRWW